MPLPSFSFNPFPDRNKPPEPTATDDLAAVKAAAWAWYQNGSGSESKPMREFDVTRPITQPKPKPSRYRLEAIRIAQTSHNNSQTPNSLLDSYEVASISRRLSNLLDPSDPNHFSLTTAFESEIMDLGRQIEGKSAKPKNFFRPFWRRPSLMCGKMEDVVLGGLVRPSDKQRHRPTPRRGTAVPDCL